MTSRMNILRLWLLILSQKFDSKKNSLELLKVLIILFHNMLKGVAQYVHCTECTDFALLTHWWGNIVLQCL